MNDIHYFILLLNYIIKVYNRNFLFFFFLILQIIIIYEKVKKKKKKKILNTYKKRKKKIFLDEVTDNIDTNNLNKKLSYKNNN